MHKLFCFHTMLLLNSVTCGDWGGPSLIGGGVWTTVGGTGGPGGRIGWDGGALSGVICSLVSLVGGGGGPYNCWSLIF